MVRKRLLVAGCCDQILSACCRPVILHVELDAKIQMFFKQSFDEYEILTASGVNNIEVSWLQMIAACTRKVGKYSATFMNDTQTVGCSSGLKEWLQEKARL